MRIRIIFLAILISFIGCRSEDTLSNSASVSYPIQLSGSTKSIVETRSAIEGEILPKDLEIGIYALKMTQVAAEPTTWTNVYESLDNTKYVSQLYQEETETTPLQTNQRVQFPSDPSVDRLWFYGYYPYTEAPSVGANGHPTIPFTIDRDNPKDVQDYLYVTPKEVGRTDGVVTLNFNHALSRLHFTMTTSDSRYSNSKCLLLTKIKVITRRSQTGTMDVMTGDFVSTGDNTEFVWSLEANPFKVYPGNNTDTKVDFMFMPNGNAIDNISIFVKDYNSEVEKEIPVYDYLPDAENGIELNKGEIKTINLNYNIRVNFDYSISTWSDSGNNYYNSVNQ